MLTDTQIERYSRQIILPQVGGCGQEKLLSAAVAVVGPGDCSTAAVYLAAAGVGSLTIIDAIAAEDGGARSTAALIAEIEGLNPDCHVRPLSSPLTSAAALEVARSHAAVIVTEVGKTGAIDNTTVVNAACVALRTPMLWARTAGFVGFITTLTGHSTIAPCYHCLLPQLPGVPEAAELPASLSATTTALVGTIHATECIKLLLGLGVTLSGRLLTCDGLDAALRETSVVKDPQCATCGAQPAPLQR